MKITIEQYDKIVTVETADGIELSEVVHDIKGALVAIGYHPTGVEDQFVPQEWCWFPERDPERNESLEEAECRASGEPPDEDEEDS